MFNWEKQRFRPLNQSDWSSRRHNDDVSVGWDVSTGTITMATHRQLDHGRETGEITEMGTIYPVIILFHGECYLYLLALGPLRKHSLESSRRGGGSRGHMPRDPFLLWGRGSKWTEWVILKS